MAAREQALVAASGKADAGRIDEALADLVKREGDALRGRDHRPAGCQVGGEAGPGGEPHYNRRLSPRSSRKLELLDRIPGSEDKFQELDAERERIAGLATAKKFQEAYEANWGRSSPRKSIAPSRPAMPRVGKALGPDNDDRFTDASQAIDALVGRVPEATITTLNRLYDLQLKAAVQPGVKPKEVDAALKTVEVAVENARKKADTDAEALKQARQDADAAAGPDRRGHVARGREKLRADVRDQALLKADAGRVTEAIADLGAIETRADPQLRLLVPAAPTACRKAKEGDVARIRAALDTIESNSRTATYAADARAAFVAALNFAARDRDYAIAASTLETADTLLAEAQPKYDAWLRVEPLRKKKSEAYVLASEKEFNAAFATLSTKAQQASKADKSNLTFAPADFAKFAALQSDAVRNLNAALNTSDTEQGVNEAYDAAMTALPGLAKQVSDAAGDPAAVKGLVADKKKAIEDRELSDAYAQGEFRLGVIRKLADMERAGLDTHPALQARFQTIEAKAPADYDAATKGPDRARQGRRQGAPGARGRHARPDVEDRPGADEVPRRPRTRSAGKVSKDFPKTAADRLKALEPSLASKNPDALRYGLDGLKALVAELDQAAAGGGDFEALKRALKGIKTDVRVGALLPDDAGQVGRVRPRRSRS